MSQEVFLTADIQVKNIPEFGGEVAERRVVSALENVHASMYARHGRTSHAAITISATLATIKASRQDVQGALKHAALVRTNMNAFVPFPAFETMPYCMCCWTDIRTPFLLFLINVLVQLMMWTLSLEFRPTSAWISPQKVRQSVSRCVAERMIHHAGCRRSGGSAAGTRGR